MRRTTPLPHEACASPPADAGQALARALALFAVARGALQSASYGAWLVDNGVRYVAVPDVALDYAGEAEATLIDAGVAGSNPSGVMLTGGSSRWRVPSGSSIAQRTWFASAAVIVKLTRVVLLAPMVAGVSWFRRRGQAPGRVAPDAQAASTPRPAAGAVVRRRLPGRHCPAQLRGAEQRSARRHQSRPGRLSRRRHLRARDRSATGQAPPGRWSSPAPGTGLVGAWSAQSPMPAYASLDERLSVLWARTPAAERGRALGKRQRYRLEPRGRRVLRRPARRRDDRRVLASHGPRAEQGGAPANFRPRSVGVPCWLDPAWRTVVTLSAVSVMRHSP